MNELDEIMYQIKVYDDEYRKNIPDEFRMSLDNGKHYGRATQVYDFTKHRYIVEYVSDNYDIHTEIKTLLQENKQLKEEIERNIKANVVLDNTNTNYASIIFDLEEWLKEEMNKLNESKLETLEELHRVVKLKTLKDIQNQIQELKEKYK